MFFNEFRIGMRLPVEWNLPGSKASVKKYRTWYPSSQAEADSKAMCYVRSVEKGMTIVNNRSASKIDKDERKKKDTETAFSEIVLMVMNQIDDDSIKSMREKSAMYQPNATRQKNQWDCYESRPGGRKRLDPYITDVRRGHGGKNAHTRDQRRIIIATLKSDDSVGHTRWTVFKLLCACKPYDKKKQYGDVSNARTVTQRLRLEIATKYRISEKSFFITFAEGKDHFYFEFN